ncbi:MAG: universal stress protein [Solirubrobacteraceae bacterium]
MFMQIVVGVDDHEGGRDAIALAKVLARPQSEITLVYVYCGDPRVYQGREKPPVVTDRERTLERIETLRHEVGIDADIRYVGATSPGRGLHELAEHQHADLLVVGSSSRGLVGRVLTGDDTRAALNGAPCAIAIAPAGYCLAPPSMREIGVGYDASSESERALGLARRLAAVTGARLSAFQAIPIPRFAFQNTTASVDEVIGDRLAEARARMSGLGGLEAHVAYGHPAEELGLYSASVDLLIVGSRSYGPIGRVIHGSTSQQLAHSARCPVLVLPRSAEIDADELAARESDTAASTGRGSPRP